MHPENPQNPDFTKICWACDVCDVDVLEYTKTPQKSYSFQVAGRFPDDICLCGHHSKRKTHSCPFPFPNTLIAVYSAGRKSTWDAGAGGGTLIKCPPSRLVPHLLFLAIASRSSLRVLTY